MSLATRCHSEAEHEERIAELIAANVAKPNSLATRCHSEAEHEERIAELIAANVAKPNSLFVCIMRFEDRK
jgi:hypothetical protein